MSIKFNQGGNDHIWFSEDDSFAIIKRISVDDFVLYKKDENGNYNWTERYFDKWDEIIKYLDGGMGNE